MLVVRVNFIDVNGKATSDKEYSFQVPEGLESVCKKDYIVVVDCATGLRVVKCVDNAYESEDSVASCPVVGVADLSVYQELLERSKKKAALLKKLKEKQKSFEETKLFRIMAEYDDEAKELLEEYESL